MKEIHHPYSQAYHYIRVAVLNKECPLKTNILNQETNHWPSVRYIKKMIVWYKFPYP